MQSQEVLLAHAVLRSEFIISDDVFHIAPRLSLTQHSLGRSRRSPTRSRLGPTIPSHASVRMIKQIGYTISRSSEITPINTAEIKKQGAMMAEA